MQHLLELEKETKTKQFIGLLTSTEGNCTQSQTLEVRKFAEHHDPYLHLYSRSGALHLKYTQQRSLMIDVNVHKTTLPNVPIS